jgi:tyrosyl-tRNA synthetase
MLIRELLVRASYAKTISEARRHIQGKAIRINGNLIEDENATIFSHERKYIVLVEHITDESCEMTAFDATTTVISFGKKKHTLIKLEEAQSK